MCFRLSAIELVVTLGDRFSFPPFSKMISDALKQSILKTDGVSL